MASDFDANALKDLFDFNTETLQTLKNTFSAVKGKTWVSAQRDAFQINSTDTFSSAFGECMGEALYAGNSSFIPDNTTDNELANAACTIMKKSFGL